MATKTAKQAQRRTRSDGERSRATILAAAGKLATVDGLDGLTIGRLADHIGMSKSGLYAHFGSKEELQLATVAAAEEVFDYDVLLPAQQADAGLPRLEAYCERFLSHVQRAVFPGGCFFTSVITEFDTRPGAVRDRVAVYVANWLGRLRAEIVQAQQDGALNPAADPDQIVFEVQSALMLANTLWVLSEDPVALDRARTAIADRIERSRRS
jgi:AcrR family transcriptional regulator